MLELFDTQVSKIRISPLRHTNLEHSQNHIEIV